MRLPSVPACTSAKAAAAPAMPAPIMTISGFIAASDCVETPAGDDGKAQAEHHADDHQPGGQSPGNSRSTARLAIAEVIAERQGAAPEGDGIGGGGEHHVAGAAQRAHEHPL